MRKTTHSKILSLVSGVAFALCGIMIMIGDIQQYLRWGPGTSNLVIKALILIGLGAALFLKNQKAVFCMAAANALYILVRSHLSLYSVFGLLAYISLALLVVFSLRPGNTIKYIWFLPIIPAVLNFFLDALNYGYFDNYEYFSIVWPAILRQIIELFAIISASAWFKSLYAERSPCQVSENAHATEIGDADKLRTYKSLLDCGAITEEEFQAKKAELLK